MRMRLAKVLLTAALLFLAVGLAFAGPKEEAVALVDRAVTYFEANGETKAFEVFRDREGGFIKGDLYIFVYDMNGVIVFHPMNPRLEGKDMTDIKDVDGVYFTREFVKTAQDPGYGWVDYRWTNPVTKKIEHKSSYIRRMGNHFIGCGIYR